MAERIFLGLYLLAAGDTLWSLRNPALHHQRLERRAVFASITLVAACFAYFFVLPQSSLYITGGFISRPLEVFPALFFALAFMAFWRLGEWREKGIDLWLMYSISLAFMGQVCMSLASENFDSAFDAAHFLKILSYTILLYGLSREIYQLYDDEARTRGRLDQHEALLAEAQEIANFGNWEWNVETNEIYWSDTLFRIFGVQKEDFKVSFDNYIERIHKDDRNHVSDLIQQCFDDGEDYEMLHRVVHPDDEIRWLQCRGKAIRNAEGQIVRLLGTAQDITEDRLNEERFSNLLEAAPDGMVICNAEGEITLVNAQTESLFGYERHELLGASLEILIPERYHHKHVDHRENYFVSPVARNMGAGVDLFGRRKDGTEFPVEVSLSPFSTPNGRVVIAAVRDVTDSRKAQQNLARYARELERSNAELERFAYVASHDMKEPLRKIQAFGDRLSERFSDTLGDTGNDYVKRMQDAAHRMASLIEDMLTYSRIEIRSGAWESVNTQTLLDSCLHNLDMLIQENNAVVNADPMPVVEGHPWQLEMLLQNLIGNALKYRSLSRDPVIDIKVRQDQPEEAWVEIEIRDNGIGFEEDYAKQIFEPFERLHTHKEYPGTGIGLSICRKVVDHHHGNITASGKTDEGASFTIRLPVHQKDVKTG